MPFGSRAARKGELLVVPPTLGLPRDGSFALAFLGRVRVHDSIFSDAAIRNNLALKRIVDLVSCSLACFIDCDTTKQKTKMLAGRLALARSVNERQTAGNELWENV